MPSATAGRAVGIVAAMLLPACGPDRGPRDWIDERAAVVSCTSAGRDRMPPVLIDLPVPGPPSGMFARRMDPLALDGLGFERDTIACAMLRVPDAAEAERSASAVADLVREHNDASAVAASIGTRCTCEVADSVGLRALVLACAKRETQAGCEVERFQRAMQSALQPVVDAVARTPPPLVHWRLVGRTDRPGWLGDHEADVVSNHSGGSTLFVRGQAVPQRRNAELIRALLEVEGVTVVVRQDGGRGLLVVRELGKELVLDHFSHAVIEADRMPLLDALDNAHIEHYIAQLDKPVATRDLVFAPQDGNMVEIDRPLLEEFDDSLLGAAPLGGGYELARERRDEPDPLVDRIAIQAPFGKEGQVLRVRASLSPYGRDWANLLPDAMLSPTLDELGLEDTTVAFEAARGGAELPFVLRGTATNALLVHGLPRVPELMRQVEMAHPNTVGGKAAAWEFAMPTDDLVAIVGADAAAEGLRGAFLQRPFTVEVGFDTTREHVEVEVQPR